MKNLAKGTLAAATAGVLLLGGAGTLAYWTSDVPVDGADLDAGHFRLTGVTCTGWETDSGDPYVAQPIVPGDSLTQDCSFTVDAAGDHLAASLAVTSPTWTGDAGMTSELSTSATYTVDGNPVTFPAAVADGDVVVASIAVDFDGPGATNASNSPAGLSAALADITVTATQAHDPV